jgi:hypothetical protein
LEDRGNPRQILGLLLSNGMKYASEDITTVIATNGTLNDEHFAEKGWHRKDIDQAATLLESGFEPHNCHYLVTWSGNA